MNYKLNIFISEIENDEYCRAKFQCLTGNLETIYKKFSKLEIYNMFLEKKYCRVELYDDEGNLINYAQVKDSRKFLSSIVGEVMLGTNIVNISNKETKPIDELKLQPIDESVSSDATIKRILDGGFF